MTDDPSLDLTAVTADDLAIDALLQSAMTGARTDDPALDLLADLLVDVGDDLPALVPVHGARPASAPRRLARGATAAVAAAAVLTMTGAAAAATSLAPVGTPLHGVGEAVRAAAGAVADAVTPGEPARPTATPASTAPAAPASPSPQGTFLAARARSAAAAGAVRLLLDQADALLDRQRPRQAQDRLEVAERRLPMVLAVDGADALRARLAALQARVDTELRPQTAGPVPPQDAPSRRPDAKVPPNKAPKPERSEGTSSPRRESGVEPTRKSPRATSPDPARSGVPDKPRSGQDRQAEPRPERTPETPEVDGTTDSRSVQRGADAAVDVTQP